MKRIPSSISLIGVVVAALAGCSKGGGSKATAPAAGAPGSQTANDPAANGSGSGSGSTAAQGSASASGSDTTDAGGKKPVYQLANVPAQFYPVLPGALALSGGNQAGLRLADEVGSAPSDSSAQGLDQVRRVFKDTASRVKMMTTELIGIDQLLGAHPECAAADCDIPDAKIKYTAEMVNLIKQSVVGDEALAPEAPPAGETPAPPTDDPNMPPPGGDPAGGAPEDPNQGGMPPDPNDPNDPNNNPPPPPMSLAGDEPAAPAGVVDGLDDLVGTELPIGHAVVKHLTDDKNGYVLQVTLTNPAQTSVYEWNDKKDKVHVSASMDAGADVADAAAPGSGSGDNSVHTTFNYTYDAAHDSLTVSDSTGFGADKYESSLALAGDPDKKDKGAATFNVKTTDTQNGHSSVTEENGYADDNGGYLQSTYSFDESHATFVIDGPATADQVYIVMPVGTTAAAIDANPDLIGDTSVGSFNGNGTSVPVDSFYRGPDADTFAGSGLPTFTLTYDPDENGQYVQTAHDGIIKVTGASSITTRTTAGYKVVFDGKGNDTDFCYVNGVDGVVNFDDGSCKSFNAGAYGETFAADVGSDGVYKPVGQVEASFSGVTVAQVNGAPLYVVAVTDAQSAADCVAKLNAAMATDTQDDDQEAFSSCVIGTAYFSGAPDTDGTADANTVYTMQAFSGVTEMEAGALVKLGFDEATAASTYALVPEAKVVAWEVTEANKDQPIDAVIEDAAAE